MMTPLVPIRRAVTLGRCHLVAQRGHAARPPRVKWPSTVYAPRLGKTLLGNATALLPRGPRLRRRVRIPRRIRAQGRVPAIQVGKSAPTTKSTRYHASIHIASVWCRECRPRNWRRCRSVPPRKQTSIFCVGGIYSEAGAPRRDPLAFIRPTRLRSHRMRGVGGPKPGENARTLRKTHYRFLESRRSVLSGGASQFGHRQ